MSTSRPGDTTSSNSKVNERKNELREGLGRRNRQTMSESLDAEIQIKEKFGEILNGGVHLELILLSYPI